MNRREQLETQIAECEEAIGWTCDEAKRAVMTPRGLDGSSVDWRDIRRLREKLYSLQDELEGTSDQVPAIDYGAIESQGYIAYRRKWVPEDAGKTDQQILDERPVRD